MEMIKKLTSSNIEYLWPLLFIFKLLLYNNFLIIFYYIITENVEKQLPKAFYLPTFFDNIEANWFYY